MDIRKGAKQPFRYRGAIKPLTTVAYTVQDLRDGGALFLFDNLASTEAALPKVNQANKGATFTFYIRVAATSGVGNTVRPNAADIFLFPAATTGQALRWVTASDAIGDHVTVISDGVNGWIIPSLRGTHSFVA